MDGAHAPSEGSLRMQPGRVCIALATLMLARFSPLLAQISQASLKGTVQDASGAAVVGATIALKDKGTGSQRTTSSDASGEYTIPNLTPADYSLTVGMSGFRTVVVESLPLHTGEQSTYNAKLEVG